MKFADGIHPRDRGDLSGATQIELHDRLLDAVVISGIRDVASWLVRQDWCAPADWLAVAHLWGGDQLRDHLAAELARKGLVPA